MTNEVASPDGALLAIIQKFWGYTQFRPLQQEAMAAAIARRDSLVVLPTGGGKSLCYQAPALLADGITVVVSPLISLMKDQVDRLLSMEIPAAFLNSSLDGADRRRVRDDLLSNRLKLLFVAPERFASEGFLSALKQARVAAFAIDEAHCISHWGHDFRSDYRELGLLKKTFAGVPVHAFTATATPRVREDIVEQLGLTKPAVLIGDFFRPNLFYRASSRGGGFDDVIDIVRRRPGQPGIVYCIRRADVDKLSSQLKGDGVRADSYHAGMSDDDRTAVQDRFAAGEIDLVVATVAFGMGIDRADIRYVVHAAMPKSLEHYQQETGRAGRDGKPADCILLYSGGDYGLWRQIIQSNDSGDLEPKMKMLSEMYSFCRDNRCRHRRLVEYFGQSWSAASCQACDLCAGEKPVLADAAEVVRRIVACVAQTGQRFGPGYVTDILCGEGTDRVRQHGHDRLDSFGALSNRSKEAVRVWIGQLVDQGLIRPDGDYGVLKLTAKSGDEATLFEAPAARKSKPSKSLPAAAPTAGPIDIGLFNRLKALRREIADEQNVPAFFVFSDKTLREMARLKPRSEAELRRVHGVGPAKLEHYGKRFLATIRSS